MTRRTVEYKVGTLTVRELVQQVAELEAEAKRLCAELRTREVDDTIAVAKSPRTFARMFPRRAGEW